MSDPLKRARREPAPATPAMAIEAAAAEEDADSAATDEEDGSDAEQFEPCVECESMPEAVMEASTFAWCEDVAGMLCRKCGDFCQRCMETRCIGEVTWFAESTADGVSSACDCCWLSDDEDVVTCVDVCGGALTRNQRHRNSLAQIRRRSAGATLVRAMRRSVFFETATSKLHAASAILGKKAAAEFAAEFGC